MVVITYSIVVSQLDFKWIVFYLKGNILEIENQNMDSHTLQNKYTEVLLTE